MRNLFSSKFSLIALLLVLPAITFAQNLTISDQQTMPSGTFGVFEMRNGADLKITGEVTVSNINFNNNQPVSITITKDGKLTVGSLNLNGKVTFTNSGTLRSGSVELQNGQNDFFNYGTHVVTGDVQVTAGQSVYNNCGSLTVTNFLNLHSGRLVMCNCGSVLTYGMNVNGTDKVEGKGFIHVTNVLNLNGHLTKSPNVSFFFSPGLSDKTKLGDAKWSSTSLCEPDPMPVRYKDLKVATYYDKDGNLKGLLTFLVLENSHLVEMKLMFSANGKQWITNFSEKPENLVVGKAYRREFYLKLK